MKTLDGYYRRLSTGDLGRFAYAACSAIRLNDPSVSPKREDSITAHTPAEGAVNTTSPRRKALVLLLFAGEPRPRIVELPKTVGNLMAPDEGAMSS